MSEDMSKLSDKIKRSARVDAGHIGFGLGPRSESATATMICLLRLDKDQAKKADRDPGADAVIIDGADPGKAGGLARSLESPLGLRIPNAGREAVQAAREAAVDFVVLDGSAAAEALLEDNVGVVLRLDGDLGDTELRALAGLPLDAIEIAPVEEPFTLRRLMSLRRLALLAQTPLLVEVEPGISASRLEALRDSGVVGVILDGKSSSKLGALRKTIGSLPARGRRRGEHSDALLPSLIGHPGDEDDEDDE
jgi:hypothetical protein